MARPVLLESDALHPGGMDSFRDPRLPDGFYQRGWNVVNRGGVLKTRPGTECLLRLPDGKLQGFTQFTPRRGATQLVACIDGQLYVSEFPFTDFQAISGATLSASARNVYWCQCEQSIKHNADDSVSLLAAPRALLIAQDGVSPPLVWDGVSIEYQTGYDKTPQGTAMAWSGGRLWVARDNEVFASDYANPLSFVEQFYLGGTDSFLVDGRVVAMSEVEGTGDPQLLVFTEASTTVVLSNVRNRNLWLQTPNFVRTLFPSTGCTSHRSIRKQFGQLWWYSQRGLTSIDVAAAENVSSAFVVADNEMAASKIAVGSREGAIALGTLGNYLLVSVPYGGRFNRHTWVMDQSVIQTLQGKLPPAWAGIWTGFQPVEWTSFVQDGKERVFAGVTDGTRNQIIEFRADRNRDSGQDIECAVELRVLTNGQDRLRELKHAELFFSEIRGTVDIRADWRGLVRGPYKQCLGVRVKAGEGCFNPDLEIDATTLFYGTRGQQRRLWTQEIAGQAPDEFTSCGVESPEKEQFDYGFNLLVSWSGVAALRGIRMGVYPEAEREAGKCEADEETFSYTRFDGSGASTIEALEQVLPIYSSTATVTAEARGTQVSAGSSKRSLISEMAAGKQATQTAQSAAARALRVLAPLVIGGE